MPDRSIRNIEISHRHAHHAAYQEPKRPRRRRGAGRLLIVAAAALVGAAVLGALLSLVFAGASVSLTPRTASVTLPGTIQAALNAPAGTLSYQAMNVTLSATTTVPANGSQQVSRPASGQLTIQNSYSASPQRLIANTRFQAPDGKVYRIHDSVVVPGMQGSQPGTVSATAYADSAGPDYNRSGNTVYTIPGFKGDPRFAKITAVSGPLSGGFVGAEPAVAQSDLAAAKQSIEQQLDAALRSQFNANIPQGYRLVDGTLSVTFGQLAQTDAGGGKAALAEGGTASGDLVRMSDLAAAVAKQTVQGYAGEAVAFADPAAVTMSASTTGQQSSITIALGGAGNLVWQIDPSAIKQALVGQPKSAFESVIKQFEPAVAKADATIRPFWTSTFPTDPDHISVSVASSK